MGEIGAEAVPATHAALLEGGVAETVIGGALVAVLEHVIGLVELFELVLALVVARIAIRMMLHGELAERGLEVGVAGLARHAQNFVIVALGHAAPASASNAVIEILDLAAFAPPKDAPTPLGFTRVGPDNLCRSEISDLHGTSPGVTYFAIAADQRTTGARVRTSWSCRR